MNRRTHATLLTMLLLVSLLIVPGLVTAQGPGMPETEAGGDVPAATGPFSRRAAPMDNGGMLYLYSIDSGTSVFAAYDPATDSWTQLNDYDTTSQMAVSADGHLYAVNYGTGDIEVYDPGSDTWAYVMDGPGVYIDKGNLEITNDGEFFLTIGYTDDLYYTSGGSWYTFVLPFNANVMGDYDPTTNQYVIGEYGTVIAHLIDVYTFAITDFTLGPGSNGEWGRFSSIMDNRYYYCTSSDPIYSYDLSDPDLPAYDHGVYPGFYVASAADRANHQIYVASLDGTDLWVFDALNDTLTPLSGNSYSLWHSSLVFVAASEPGGEMHVADIQGYPWANPGGFPAWVMGVRVVDGNDMPLAQVFVEATVWIPEDQAARTRYSLENGWARFWAPAARTGNYQICVDNLTLDGYSYNPDDNVVTCLDWDL